jgi:RNA polymerase sigma-70 factor (ECF subfamily)
VARLIRQYGNALELRQELPGEIYCRFCRLLEDYDPGRGTPIKAYLVRTLPAAVYTYARAHWRRCQRESSLSAEVEPGLREPPADPSREWDQGLLLMQVLQQLPAAIAALPLRQRQVVVMRYYENRSFAEIAAALRVKPATARSLLRHGIERLRAGVRPPELF